jgi:hypothetical protein
MRTKSFREGSDRRTTSKFDTPRRRPGGAGENRPLRLGRLARDGLFDDAHDQHEHSTADASASDLFND